MILSSQSIQARCALVPPGFAGAWPLPMIDPFEQRTQHVVAGTTFGLGPCTYDVRVKDETRLWPGEFRLAVTLERFVMPLDVCATVMDKSSLARRGIAVQNTHIDPGWEGWLTLELANHGTEKILLGAGYPVAQIKFEMLDFKTQLPYTGKYQNQPAVPVPALRGTK